MRKLKMKKRSFRSIVNDVDNKNSTQFRDMLSTLLNVIGQFENNRNLISKNTKERVDILKKIVSDMMRDDYQKRVIMGDQ
jgi:hypothetical protein